MKRRIFIPFYVLLAYSCVSLILFGIYFYILVFIRGINNGWNDVSDIYIYIYIFISAYCIAVPMAWPFLFPRFEIDLNKNRVTIFYLVDWRKNRLDCDYNWFFYHNQIEDVVLVKLSNDEKKKYTSSRFLFHKYLRVNLKSGNVKYVYIALYSNFQIKKIIKMLKNN